MVAVRVSYCACLLFGVFVSVAEAQFGRSGPAVSRPAASPSEPSEDKGKLPRPQGLGQLLIRDAQANSATRLNIARYHVDVLLRPPLRLTALLCRIAY